MNLTNVKTEAMENWLHRHRFAIAAGFMWGELDKKKAQAFRAEIIRRKRAKK